LGLSHTRAILHDICDSFSDLFTVRPARPARLKMNGDLPSFSRRQLTVEGKQELLVREVRILARSVASRKIIKSTSNMFMHENPLSIC
jgi:hypothetical protein